MTSNSPIRYITQARIDKYRWDQCVEGSINGLIYAYSIYLDRMAIRWDALVLGDYEAVMPLTWNAKWGIRYLCQPPFTPQLGIFSIRPLSFDDKENFLTGLKSKFRFAEIYLNYANEMPGLPRRNNFILNLNRGYEDIRAGYKTDLEKNLKRAERFGLRYSMDNDIDRALQLHQQEYAARFPHLLNDDFNHFATLCHQLAIRQKLVLRSVFDEAGQLQATALLLNSHRRLYLIESTTLREGRDRQANHFLLDQLIREFSGKDLLLDFEGSDHEGIAHFYQNFGPVNEPRYFLYHNRLPWPLRWLK